MYSRLRTAISVAALVAVAGACGSDSPTQPATKPVTLNQALAELSLPTLNTARATFGGVPDLIPALTAARCPYSSAAQSFVCTTVNSGGIAIDQSFTLLTAGGASQSAFDAASTDAVRANTTISGTVQQQGTSYTFDGVQELTVSGLKTDTHSLDGSGTLVADIDNGTGITGTLTLTETIAGLKLPASSPSATVWPTTGTMTLQLVSDVTGQPTSTITVTLTFTGTSTVHVTIVDNGVTTSCDQNFLSPSSSCS
jgi:hypothetical protein